MRPAGAFWYTIVFNVVALFVAVLLVAGVHLDAGVFLLPLSFAISVIVGLVAVLRRQMRGLGLGSLGGVVASVLIFALLLVVFFVTYFVLGGHELS